MAPASGPETPASVEPSVAVSAGRMIARLARTIERSSSDEGLSLAQYRLLAFVARAPQRAGVLAAQDAVSGPSLTARVDALEAKGLVRRSPVEADRRGVELALTADGHAAVDRIEARVERRLNAIFPTPEGQALLAALANADQLWQWPTVTRRGGPRGGTRDGG